jgi:hypothetical protein
MTVRAAVEACSSHLEELEGGEGWARLGTGAYPICLEVLLESAAL